MQQVPERAGEVNGRLIYSTAHARPRGSPPLSVGRVKVEPPQDMKGRGLVGRHLLSFLAGGGSLASVAPEPGPPWEGGFPRTAV